MTREEAIAVIEDIIESEFRGTQGLVGPGPRVLQALTTLAPAVRYEPPTPKEVGYRQKAWGYSCGSWHLVTGSQLRHFWEGTRWGSYTAWVHRSAIPEGGA